MKLTIVPATTYKKIIDAYPDAILLGLTATPCRGDGRGLGGIFERMIECPQVAELIAGGYLVKTRTYAPVNPDLKGVRTVAGDYNEGQLADRMDRPKLIGDIVTHWHKFGERRKTVAFAVNVAHSVHLRDEFIKSGVRAEHIDGSTPKPERDATLARLASGEIELVTNCMVLTEGWDMPGGGVLHPRASDPQDGSVPADDRPHLAPGTGQERRNRARSFGRRVPARLCGRPGRMDARSRSSRREPCPYEAVRERMHRACSNARNAALSASVANRARSCGFLPQRPPRACRVW